ncbi:TetR/AcrR family transcriptional regulator [Thermomonas sp.]|uniref:TetR/AcrR family transcriptional regulator n=1 Tax=Thermomonas sp. TaxID=1971895 RepID=UPI001D55CEA3|nr:TetR/AcrR family transcriptional regulator [Thermomonas sp.]MBZ0087366.1 TetR/AcrR family transcriptional regulator [Thermomonas sp.]HRO62699.1 TetR/AcrR family transcriptional regulator [Thermomonas sp.]
MPQAPRPKPGTPGRPKDMQKRAAILAAATRLFLQDGFERVNMDQIAADAGVSKLTVYSHFGDKDRLFIEAVRAHCEQSVPDRLFQPRPDLPLRKHLINIGTAFFAMVMTPEAIAGFRILCSPQAVGGGLPLLAWEAGPKHLQEAFTELLQRRIATGELEIADPAAAAGHFFTLLKGEPHAQAVVGVCCSPRPPSPKAHVASVVDLFLRAYGKR